MITLLMLAILARQCLAQVSVTMWQFDSYNDTLWKAVWKRGDCGRDAQVYHSQSCNTNNLANVQLVDGNLVLTAIQQDYFGSKFTTGSVQLNASQLAPYEPTDGQVVIRFRASLPTVEALEPQIILVFGHNANRPNSVNLLGFDRDRARAINLAQFNNYNVTLLDHYIQMDINGVVVANETIVGHPGFDSRRTYKIFGISISLVVNENKLVRKSDQLAHKCTSFILDYLLYHHTRDIADLAQIGQEQIENKSNAQSVCKIAKQSQLDNYVKFVPNQNYTILLHDYLFNANQSTRLDKSDWIYKEYPIVNDCDRDKDRYFCDIDPVKYQIEQGTLRLLHLDDGFKKSTIATKNNFKNVRIEVKARRPSAVNLFTAFYLLDAYKDLDEAKNEARYQGFVQIARVSWRGSMVQNELRLSSKTRLVTRTNVTKIDLDQFQVYGLEWSDDYIVWFVDDRVVYQTNRVRDQTGNSLYNSDEYPAYLPFEFPFKLYIKIGIDNLNDISKVKQANRAWLDVQYIRVYGDQNSVVSIVSSNNQTGQAIGSTFMVIVVVSMVILVLVVLLTITFVRLRKTKRKLMDSRLESHYDDHDIVKGDYQETYGEYIYTNVYEMPHTVIGHPNSEYLEIFALNSQLNSANEQ